LLATVAPATATRAAGLEPPAPTRTQPAPRERATPAAPSAPTAAGTDSALTGNGPAPTVFLLALLAAALLRRPALSTRLRDAARILKPPHTLSPLERPG
jgi:hypothetical protein